MKGYVSKIDWINAECMKYWSFPSGYSMEKKKKELNDAIYSGRYYGALKVDGYYQRLIKDEDGNCFMIARNKNVNNEAVNKYEWVPQLHSFMAGLPNGTVLLSECYLPGNEGSSKITSLLGCLKEKCIARQEKEQELHFYIFDVCAYNGKDFTKTSALERFKFISYLSKLYQNKYIEWAIYYNGKELWENLQNYLVEGREGMVITREDAPIYFKRTPAHVTIKVKKELQETVDAIVLGANPPVRLYKGKEIENWKYWENTRTGEKINGAFYKDYSDGANIEPISKSYYNGWAGSLVIGMYKDGVPTPIGSVSGITEEILSNWKDYIGKVCEIGAMEVLDTGGLRHSKFIKFRDDLRPEDTDWYRVFGGRARE